MLFNLSTEGEKLIEFMKQLSKHYKAIYKKLIYPVLDIDLNTTGLSFGMERGSLMRIVMNGRSEYIGRPMNIACRLQTAVADTGKTESFKALISKQVYNSYFKRMKNLNISPTRRTLKNIHNGQEYRCMELDLLGGRK